MFNVSKNIRILLVTVLAFASIFFVSVPKKDIISSSNNNTFNQVTSISANEEMFVEIEMLMMTASTLFTPTIEDRNNDINNYTLHRNGDQVDLSAKKFENSSAAFWAKQITYTYSEVTNDNDLTKTFSFQKQINKNISLSTSITSYAHYIVEQTANDAQKNLSDIPNSIIRQCVGDNLSLSNLEQSVSDFNNYLISYVISSPLYLTSNKITDNKYEGVFFLNSEKNIKNKYFVIEIIIAIIAILGLILLMGYKLKNNRRFKK